MKKLEYINLHEQQLLLWQFLITINWKDNKHQAERLLSKKLFLNYRDLFNSASTSFEVNPSRVTQVIAPAG